MTVITALPTPPTRSDPSTFAARADTFLTALPTFATETNLVAAEVNADAASAAVSATNANASKLAAQQSEIAAAASVSAAAAAAGAVKWVSGTTYAEGVVVWSPLTFFNYRRKIAGAGTTDPSLDAVNWFLIGAPLAMPQVYISTNTTAQPGIHYIITAALTLTFPASPQERDVIMITDVSNTANCFINPNGKKIRNDATVMKLNTKFTQKAFYYTTDATQGWI
jgi:hypothetical protein